MRELKFRHVYEDKITNSLFTKIFTLAEIQNGDPVDEISDSPVLRNHKIISIDQYTGLKDSKGKEIYEGDFINLDPEHFADNTSEPRMVFFSKGSFRTLCGNNKENEVPSILHDYDIRTMKEIIVGNIHEGIVDLV
jgi:hypothetical protein